MKPSFDACSHQQLGVGQCDVMDSDGDVVFVRLIDNREIEWRVSSRSSASVATQILMNRVLCGHYPGTAVRASSTVVTGYGTSVLEDGRWNRIPARLFPCRRRNSAAPE